MKRYIGLRRKKSLKPSTLYLYKTFDDRKKIEKRLDVLFSKIIRLRDRKCVRCGKDRNLQTSHVFSRSNKSVRWDLHNAVLLDSGCHIFWWHKNPIEATEFIQRYLGPEKYSALKIKAGFIIKRGMPDLLFLEEQLKEKLKEISR